MFINRDPGLAHATRLTLATFFRHFVATLSESQSSFGIEIMRITKHLQSLLIIVSLVTSTLAQQSPGSAPSVERLRDHIHYLASDRLSGRKTGSLGANVAAEYIAREFARLGLRRSVGFDTAGMSIREADSPNRYLQKFPYVAGVELGKRNTLTLNPPPLSERVAATKHLAAIDFRVGEDWMPLGLSSNGLIENAGYVFAGYGITAAELNYDSYGSGSKDKVAIILSGTPDGDNPHGQFARYGDIRWKAIAARNAGVKALLVVAREENLMDERLAKLRYDNSGGDSGLPVAIISRSVAAKIFDPTGDPKLTLAMLAQDAAAISPSGPRAVAARQVAALPFIGVTFSVSVDLIRKEVSAANVVGILDGSDPVLKREAIIIGAHYDHLGLGGEGSLAAKEGEIHHGADDNASGTAGLLELARIFTSAGFRPKRTIVFIAFGGEEEGLLGSNYYVKHPTLPLANTVAMINMDMIGRMKENKLIIGGVGTAQEWRKELDSLNIPQLAEEGGSVKGKNVSVNASILLSTNPKSGPSTTVDLLTNFQLTLNEDGFGPSDHSSFYAKQIPVLFFWTGTHEDYHKPSDTADKINYEDEARILEFVARLVRDVDAETKRPTYAVAKSQQAAGRTTSGFNISLGTIPNYADSSDGLLIDGVRENSPAATAGIKAGDKIVKLAGRDIRNVYDYTAALGEMRAGQEYEVELVRNGERLKMKIIPAARR